MRTKQPPEIDSATHFGFTKRSRKTLRIFRGGDGGEREAGGAIPPENVTGKEEDAEKGCMWGEWIGCGECECGDCIVCIDGDDCVDCDD